MTANKEQLVDKLRRAKDGDPVERQRERDRTKAHEREYVEALKEHSFRKFLTELVRDNVRPLDKPAYKPPRKASKSGHKRYPLLTLNDWHFEEKVNPEGVLGLNEYSIATACRRVHRIVNACIAWKVDMESGGQYVMPELVIAGLGDMVTGTLHNLEKHSGAPNIVRAALACGDLFALAISDLAGEFGKVTVHGVSGNHGRLPDDRKVPTKDPTRSWDYLVYATAARRLAHDDRVTFNIPNGYGHLFHVGSHHCYMAHGNFIPNNLGVVGYGVRRFAASLGSNLSAAGKPLKYCFFGHWHSAHGSEFAGMECFIAPSLIGTQEYSFLQGGSVNRPAQSLFVFGEEHGLLSQERLYGDGKGYKGSYKVDL